MQSLTIDIECTQLMLHQSNVNSIILFQVNILPAHLIGNRLPSVTLRIQIYNSNKHSLPALNLSQRSEMYNLRKPIQLFTSLPIPSFIITFSTGLKICRGFQLSLSSHPPTTGNCLFRTKTLKIIIANWDPFNIPISFSIGRHIQLFTWDSGDILHLDLLLCVSVYACAGAFNSIPSSASSF